VACESNLRQIGMAAFMYAADNKGQLPPSHTTPTIEKFLDWGVGHPNRDQVRTSMARYLGVKIPPAGFGAGDPPGVPVLYCPVALQLGIRGPGMSGGWDARPENFLKNLENGSISDGKILYYWVANPFQYDLIDPTNASFGMDKDLWAAKFYWHQDGPPDSLGRPTPVVDMTRKCQPGVEYLRTTRDKNAMNVAIATDQSRQIQALAGGWFYLHGNGTSDKRKGWKNSLMGDGHVQRFRGDEVRSRWGPANPAAW